MKKIIPFLIISVFFVGGVFAIDPIFWNKMDYSTAQVKGGLQLDGTGDYVALNDFGGKPNKFTVMGWLKPNSWASGVTPFAGGIGDDLTIWGLSFYTGETMCWASNGVNDMYPSGVIAADWDSTNYPSTKWTHAACNWNGTHMRYYRDGVLINTVAWAYNNEGIAYNFSIGRLGEVDGYYLNGGIDEVKVFNRSLSDAEISDIVVAELNHTKPAYDTTGLMGEYIFDSNVTDTSGNGNDGLLQGDAIVGWGDLSLSEIGNNGIITGTIYYNSAYFNDGISSPSLINNTDYGVVITQTQSNNPFTIEGWFVPDFASSYAGMKEILQIDDRVGGNYGVLFDYGIATAGEFLVAIYSSYGGGIGSMYSFTPAASFNSGDKIHFAIVANSSLPVGERIKLYQNGVLTSYVSSYAGFDSAWSFGNDIYFHIGGAANWVGASNTTKDNIKIYDYAKTDFSDRFTEGIGGSNSSILITGQCMKIGLNERRGVNFKINTPAICES